MDKNIIFKHIVPKTLKTRFLAYKCTKMEANDVWKDIKLVNKICNPSNYDSIEPPEWVEQLRNIKVPKCSLFGN